VEKFMLSVFLFVFELFIALYISYFNLKSCGYFREQNNPCNRPGQALNGPGVWGSQILTQSVQKSGTFVGLYAQGNISVSHIWLEAESPRRVKVRPEGLCQ